MEALGGFPMEIRQRSGCESGFPVKASDYLNVSSFVNFDGWFYKLPERLLLFGKATWDEKL